MTHKLDALIVGAGFAGLYMLHRLRGMGLSVRIFEAGTGVGGTWYWNRYPGARCDVESMQYSYQFDDDLQQEWVTKAKARQRAKAKAGQKAKKRQANAESSTQVLKPGHFDPAADLAKNPRMNLTAKNFSGAKRGAARSR